jgi:hypothetical protein
VKGLRVRDFATGKLEGVGGSFAAGFEMHSRRTSIPSLTNPFSELWLILEVSRT